MGPGHLGLSLAFTPHEKRVPRISPSAPTVIGCATQTFTASGGSGTGYVFSLTSNPSGGSITSGGTYTAGPVAGTDVVHLVDSLGASSNANVVVTSIGCRLWLTDQLGVPADGALVSTWADQSGFGFDATAAGAQRPTYHSSGGPNGRGRVSYGGTQWLNNATITGITAATLFVVGTNTGDTQTFFAGTIGGNANSGFAMFREAGVAIRARRLNVGNSNAIALTAAVFSMEVNDSFVQMFQNGTSVAPDTTAGSQPAIDGYSIGALRSIGLYNLVGDISEVILLDHIATNSEYAAVDKYLGTKYGYTVP